ncbi:MinD/ParA family protein [Bacillus sp. RO2]|uniref:MinD/ParA family protein n=1 Tax=Bacillus sp. RO2 TaxID=2723913 RepID=UPI00145D95DB|nr:MinD/ParA family protein [Bacillus sp. RO2]NMH74902.1 MinD/ParA family protein [Bacillus sp. RO2]
MNDQARALREQVKKSKRQPEEEISIKKETRAIAVMSGKGGVGKSNFSLNFSLTLQKKGYKVLLFDMDIGMANIDILLGVTQRYSILHLFERNLSLEEIVQEGPEGLSYIAGGSGLKEIFHFDEQKRNHFLSQLQRLSFQFDYIIFDMGAGITSESLQLILACNEIILISTCEPTAMTDAYSAMKFIHNHDQSIPFQLVVNRSVSPKHAISTALRLQSVTQQFLNRNLSHLGSLPDDKYVTLAVMEQTPFVLRFPNSHVSRAVRDIAVNYLHGRDTTVIKNTNTFIHKLRRLFG